MATEKPNGFVYEDLKETKIPAATGLYLNRLAGFRKAFKAFGREIFSEWLPATNFEHADAPELEVFPPGNRSFDDTVARFGSPSINYLEKTRCARRYYRGSTRDPVPKPGGCLYPKNKRRIAYPL